jgi:hypothetical protein
MKAHMLIDNHLGNNQDKVTILGDNGAAEIHSYFAVFPGVDLVSPARTPGNGF